MKNTPSLTIGLIGNGTIASVVARHCEASNGRLAICGALGLPVDQVSMGKHTLVKDLSELIELRPDLIVECASQDAVFEHGTAVLAAGIDFMVISVGAFSHPDLAGKLEKAAAQGGTRVIIPAGALAGLDALGAASTEPMTKVTLTTRKPPKAWAGAPGVADIDLSAIAEATPIFTGTAREAAQSFPKNANVAAALALAGIGMDNTKVTLIADPEAQKNCHHVEAEGAFGRLSTTIEAEPSPDNPKTSYLAALSITRMLDRLTALIAI